jgi:Flp pilus assembly pilin Flp
MLKTYAFAQTKIGQFKTFIEELRQDEEGAAMIEYALLVGVLVVGSVAALLAFRGVLGAKFTEIGNGIKNAK